MRNPVLTSYRDCHGYEGMKKKKNRPNDVISIPRRSYVSLNGYILSFRARENARARSVILIFAIFNVFHKRQSTRNTFLPNLTTTLPCTRSPSTLTVLNMETFVLSGNR